MKEKIKTQKGFIRIPILITIIIGVAMISGGGYFGYTKFKDYQVQKSEKEKLAQEIEWLWQEKEKQQKDEQENKDTELEKLKKEIEAIKNQQIVESKEKLSSQTIKITSDELQQYSSGIGIIYCYGDNFTQGSGSLWHINNLSGLFVLTNRHVITTSNCHIFFEDPRYVGVSIGRYKLDTVNIQAWNNKTDIALLKILYPSLDTSEPLSFLSPKLSNLSFCNQQ